MEDIQSAFRKISDQTKQISSSFSSFDNSSPSPNSSSFSPGVIITRPPRHLVSLWTCSKLCGVFFVAGIFVGYTLKRRVRRWVSGLLRRLKDD